jgi:hypothetical protein
MDDQARAPMRGLWLAGRFRRGRERGVAGVAEVAVVGDAAEQGADDVGEGQRTKGKEKHAGRVQAERAGRRGVGHTDRIDPRIVAAQASLVQSSWPAAAGRSVHAPCARLKWAERPVSAPGMTTASLVEAGTALSPGRGWDRSLPPLVGGPAHRTRKQNSAEPTQGPHIAWRLIRKDANSKVS